MSPEGRRSTDPIYLDHAATTGLQPEVAEAMRAAEADAFGNPSSPHRFGRTAKRLLEESRERILGLLGACATGHRADRLVFTSGATEANRLAVLGLAGRGRGLCRFSARDHRSVAVAAGELERRGWDVATLPLDHAGGLDPGGSWLETPPADRRLLCLTLVCGQSGVRQDMAPVRAAAALAPGLLAHLDATQACSKAASAFAEPAVATLSIAPHKFGGPRGIGGLLVRSGMGIEPVVPGPQERGLRGGTEPVPLVVGFARALELALAAAADDDARLATLRDRFEHRMVATARAAGVAPLVIGGTVPRAPHIATIAFPGIDRQAFVMAADLEGVACATGTACASGSSEPAPALVAMGLPAEVVESAVRFSFGRSTTDTDVETAVERLEGVLLRTHPRRGS